MEKHAKELIRLSFLNNGAEMEMWSDTPTGFAPYATCATKWVEDDARTCESRQFSGTLSEPLQTELLGGETNIDSRPSGRWAVRVFRPLCPAIELESQVS